MMMKADDDASAASGAKRPAKKATKTNTDVAQDDSEGKEGFMQKMQKGFANCCASTGLCCFKFKSQTQISALEFKIANRQKKFGVDYLTLVERKASQAALKECLKEALRDVAELQTQVNNHYDSIDNKASELQKEKEEDTPPTAAAAARGDRPKPETRQRNGAPVEKAEVGPDGEGANKVPPKKKAAGGKKKKKKQSGPDERFSIDDE